MCGIVGVVGTKSEPISEELVRAMRDTMIHRGPDDAGIYVDGRIGFGHRRLSIIDLSEAGRQPMENEDGSMRLVFNGEIYNFQALRSELESAGHRFRSRTDAEVVVHAYEEWGERSLDRFNGMFAFAIWDAARERLFIARDRYGIKPIYYIQTESAFLFASEVKALLEHPDVTASVDPYALLEYFTFQNILTDRTLFAGVQLLPAGSWAALDAQDPTSFDVHEYWDFSFEEPSEASSMEEYEEELVHLFRQAVDRQLMSDVPVGAYLSGGMDSGAITAVAAQSIPYLTSFTGGFDLSSASGLELNFDERARAEALSYRFRTEHYQVVMKSGDMERIFPDLIWHLEDLRVGQCYPNYYVAGLAGKFVKVVLAGTGGDELFAGYPWRYYRAVANESFDEYVEKYYAYWQRLVRNKIIHELFQPHIWEQVRDTLTIDTFRSVIDHNRQDLTSPEEYVNRSLYFEAKTFMHGLLIVEDKLSMAHSLETRVPFLDNDLVDFAMRLPVQMKLQRLDEIAKLDENVAGDKISRYFEKTNDGKLILRNALSRFVPEEYVRAIKQGFSSPDASWFRGESIEYVRELILDEGAQIYQYLRPDTVFPLIQEHLDGKRNRRLLIWSLLSFEWWLRRFVG